MRRTQLRLSELEAVVCTVLTCYRQGMTMEEIVQQYPHLRPADTHDALAYACDHPDKMEADLAADDEVTVQQHI